MSTRPLPRAALALILGVTLAIGAIGGWLWHARSGAGASDKAALDAQLAAAGISPRERGAFEALVRAYLLDHPEILPEAMERLQARETAATIRPLRAALETPFAGAVLGNPQGKRVLVEFADFSCTYCRRAEADLVALIAADPQLKVVIRLLPIISADSEPAARMGLAAARQGRYPAFHRALFGAPDAKPATVSAAAQAAGLDGAAQGIAASEQVTAELAQNMALARRLGIQGTPAWVTGDRLLSGAVGKERLAEALGATAGSLLSRQ